MAPCEIALQKLLNTCHSYSITVDVNFNALKSFCVAFTRKLLLTLSNDHPYYLKNSFNVHHIMPAGCALNFFGHKPSGLVGLPVPLAHNKFH